MKKLILSISMIILLVSASSSLSNPGQLLKEAQELEKKGNYIQAEKTYKQAKLEFMKKAQKAMADICRIGFQRMEKIGETYPYTAANVTKLVLEKYPDIDQSRIASWLEDNELPSININGTTYYFDDFMNTVIHKNLDLMQQDQKSMETYRNYYKNLKKVINQKANNPVWQPYVNPINYKGKGTLSISRDKLAQVGIFKLWIPLPTLTGCQTDAQLISVTPKKYVKFPARTSGEMGSVYLEIPLNKLEDDLKIETQFSFKHFEQRFNMIDPDKVGKYNKKSPLYQQYTTSGKNIKITPEISKKAQEVVGDEKNPFIRARKLYNYVVDDITYSHLPYLALDALNYPISQYVYDKQIGDCGAQSIYFAALCRSIGIPARAPGGWQMIGGTPGTHFWAEFYLENYGWVPVDTSVAQLYKYLPELSEEQKETYKNFFFTNMDPYRYIIQEDVDIELIPAPPEPPLFPLVLQTPTAICDTMDEIPGVLTMEYWKLEITPQ
ncbi:MAG: transglutaminase domain-containing protein [Candidatus Saganbacteria bacterium]|nr:transglutaminase domain-containing protein [Candidatus Saganbacteria bacterium]